MVTITINGEKKQYPKGTLYEEIAKEYQPSYKDMIALVIENGKIRELIKPANKDCELDFVTIRNSIGHKTYVRTATMMLVKAVYDVLGGDQVKKVKMEFAIGQVSFMLRRNSFNRGPIILPLIESPSQFKG